MTEASESEYFPLFLELDKLTDKEVAKKLAEIDDTKYFESRAGARFANHGLEPFFEAFNSQQPEKCEYVQVRKTSEGYLFSASHKSYYLRYELGPMYEAYYPNAEPEKYLFETYSLDDLGQYEFFKPTFMMIIKIIKNNFERNEENDMSIKEISRRAAFHTDECGISGIDSVDAEIVVENEGKRVFLHAQWVSEAADDIIFETTYESAYDIYEKMFDPAVDVQALCDERDRVVAAGMTEEESAAKYPEQHEALIEMVKAKLAENGIEIEEDADEDI